ncbi:MAG: 3'-5' exonuclease [Desulfobulbaceae bacterium]|nr:3'-5' exonuclease [Desulfobulbaceae bacterium]
METIAVIDFETTGLSPNMGDRATEVAVVLLEGGVIVDRYQSLMNAGVRIPPFIEELTGISNAMIRKAPPVTKVMKELADFVGKVPLVAHNASFDRKFLDAEWNKIRKQRQQEFVCTMLLARRIYKASPNHKLGTLVNYLGLPCTGRYHRAMADAEMTAHLLVTMVSDLEQQYGLRQVSHEFLRSIQTAPKVRIDAYVERAKSRFGL